MSKEYLDAFKRIKNFLGFNYCNTDLPNEIESVEQALKRLELIDSAKINRDITTNYVSFHQDNVNPSEALEYLKDELYIEGTKGKLFEAYETIKQALIRLNGFDKEYEEFKGLPFEEILKFYKDKLVIDSIINEYEKLKSTKSKKELAWEICIKKHISIWRFRNIVFGYEQKQNGNFVNDTYEYYKNHFGYYHEGFEFELLTQEEFEILKEVLK